ncbi:hypothetical protein [Ferdinandcohnia sp. Marseille-Q9671]
MKKYLYVSLIVITIVTLVAFYVYREQNLSELFEMDNVEKVYILTEFKDQDEFELINVDQETLNNLADFFKQYQVRLTNKDGWVSDNDKLFHLYLGYTDRRTEVYTIDPNVVASNRVYKIVNAPLDYNRIKELEREIHAK